MEQRRISGARSGKPYRLAVQNNRRLGVMLLWSALRQWYGSTAGYAVTGAALLWASLPPLDLWPLAWVAPVWWILLARCGQLSGRRPYAVLWVVGFLFWMAALHWLRLPHWAASFGWLALSLYQAFYLPVFVALMRVGVRLVRISVILAAPVLWTGLELARAHLITGITMASLGHTQYRWIELIQISDLAGAYAVSFVVMFVAACVARMIPCEQQPRAWWPVVPALALVAAAALYGHLRLSGEHTAPGARIVLIQGCIDTQMKSDPKQQKAIFRHYDELSREALRDYRGVDLMVWPETMFRDALVTADPDARKPDWFDGSDAEFRKKLGEAVLERHDALASTAQSLGTPMILGVQTDHYGADGVKYYNSAAYVGRDGKLLGRYDKMHLVMFGEYVPFAQYFSWLQRLTPLSVSVTPGSEPAAFRVGGLRVAPNICYESVLPHVIRRQVNTLTAGGSEPDVLVNLTNDGWFWGSSELDMHLVCAVFRAVECRKPFLIAANTGFSAWIDADGHILEPGQRRATDTILAEVEVDRRRSWYLAYGDWPAGVCLACCVLLGAFGCVRRWHLRRLCFSMTTLPPCL